MFFSGIRAVVMDIEGTTSSIAFVHDVLFPYARERLPDYVRTHIDDMGDILAGICQETGASSLSVDGAIHILLEWMKEDRKVTPLKTLQGKIWADGYACGAFKGHVFPDVAPCLKNWSRAGVRLYVYSSGSVSAQRQIFGSSEAGDLTPYFDGYFDTTTGGKKDPESYTRIAGAVGVVSSQLLFLSDHPDELDAARMAGCCVLGLVRPGNTFDLGAYPTVTSFDAIEIENQNKRTAS